jgi:EAL and modified HD-GYP domain-containing signal transduction protein
MHKPGSVDESSTVLMNRHPIYDSKLNTVGYETQAHSGVIGQASAGGVALRTILKLLAENFDTLAGNCWGLVHLPHSAILAGDHEVLPRDRVVIGIEDAPADDLLFDLLTKLATQGYRLALPVTNENLRTIAGPADILTLKLAGGGEQSVPARFEPSTHGAKLLVSEIETHEDFKLCQDLGCDLFEGYFFCTPNVSVKSVPLARLATVQLIAALQNPDVRVRELEDLIRYDVPLSYKLLQFVNSAYAGLHHKVTSIRHAISMIGIGRIRNWASLLLFASVEHKPRELVMTAAIRARMCEQLADSKNENRRATFFTVGLLSVLDALMDVPMAEALQGLSLSEEIFEALVHRSGPLGMTLRAVVAYEQSDWKRHALLRFRPSKLHDSYLESLHWTRAVAGGLTT